MILDHLAQARDHVALGEKHIVQQRELVGKLDRDGHDASAALSLLRQFEEMQVQHVTHRDRLEKELAGLSD